MSTQKAIPPKVLVEHIMTTPVASITTDLKVWQAIEFLIKKQISGAPIVDSTGKLVSIFGGGDSLRLAAKHGLEVTLAHCIADLPNVKSILTLKASNTFEEAYRMFLQHKVHRLPVVDGNGHVQGIVTRGNILRLFIEAHYGKKIAKRTA